MKKKLLNLLLVAILLIAIPGTLMLAADISGALYKMSITVSNNGTLANYVSTNTVVSTNSGWISTPNLIAGGFLNSSANNCAVLDAADNDVPFMPGYSTNPWVFWVETIGADSYINYDLYTADTTGGTIGYFPDTTGMIVSDNSTLELGSDFEVEVEGWVDTITSANKSLVFKDGAFRTDISADEEITSTIAYGAPNFPTVEAVNGGNDVVNQNNHTVNLPAGIVSGDLLIALFASDGDTTITFPGGWTQLFQDLSVAVKFGAWYRIADGGEGASIIVTTDLARMTAHTTYRISGYSGIPEVETSVTAVSDSPDPPNLTPSWGARYTLWFAICGYDVGMRTVTAYPANYTDGRNDRANHADGCGVGSARRELNAASENPGVFTLSAADEWVANTIAIAPADIEVTATSISSGEYTVKTYGVANEPAWATGDVLHFTGAADSNINAGAIHNASAKLWISLWFRPDTTIDNTNPATIYLWGKQTGGVEYITLRFMVSGKLQALKKTAGVDDFRVDTTEASWSSGVWYHVILSTSSVVGMRMIVDNGTPETNADVSAIGNGGDFIIGDLVDPGGGDSFIGEIQNVIVGTDDLSVAEEAALYAGTAPGDETNYWYIDEGTGLTTYDYGTGGNDGTIDNAPTWETATFTTGKTGRLCDFYIEVDDGVTDPDRWGANLKGTGVNDNGNDWEFFLNDAMPYVYRDEITVGGVLHAWHEWEYDTIFHDRSYYGLDFDGVNDIVTVADDASLNSADALTILVWTKMKEVSAGTHGIIAKCSQAEYATSGYNLLHTTIALRVVLDDTTTIGSTATDDDAWHLVGFSWDKILPVGDPGIIYNIVDGAFEDVGNRITSLTNSIDALRFGTYFDGTAARSMEGLIDEVLIYNRALTQDEIDHEYNGGTGNYTPYSTSGLVGHWHIETGSGTGAILVDSSGEGNTGTITGATWVNGKVPRPAGSSGTNDATPSFRTASSDADVVATAVRFQPIEEAKAPAWTLLTDTATWYSAANITGNFTTTPTPTFPGAGVIEDISAATGTPAQLPFTILYGFIILAVSLTLSSMLRHYGSRSLLVKVIVIGGILGIGEALGVIDFWMLLFFLIMALTFMAASKPGGVV